MARPRTPKAKAEITGHAAKQKTKFESRNEPKIAEGVGDPFEWLDVHAKKAWQEIASEVPWLNWSHRGFLAIAANIRGRMMNPEGGEVGVQALNLLRQCYGQMGATPADASKAGARPNDDNDEDPSAKYFT